MSRKHAIEAGTPTVAIGTVFEVATILGIHLFDAGPSQMPALLGWGRDRLALLPAHVRQPSTPVDDDF
jgi:hypothetical protein